AQGEWLSTRFEFESLISGECVDVVQPDIGRVGGFTEALRVCDFARRAGLVIVPHAWKTGISVAAAAHLAMVTPEMPFFEFLPAELCESSLRKELVQDELVFADGVLRPPERPGLGVEIDADALACLRAGAWCVEPELLREHALQLRENKFRKEKVDPTVDRLLEQPVRRPVGDQRRDENVRVADDPNLQARPPRTSSTHASPSSGPIPRSSARSRAYR